MPAKRATARVYTVPAPIGGWNVRDQLPDMKPTDAVILDNCFCMPSEIMIRRGYTDWATGMAGTVKTIFDYDAPSGTEKIFAATDNAGTCQIYDVTSSGAVGAAVVTGLTSAKIRHCHFTNSGGTFVHVVNGADSLRIYNGTTWYTITGVSAPYAITGVTTSTLIDVVVHKRRLWFVESGTMSCWYLAIDAISGAATKFDFGPIFSRGGHIIKIDTWTLDAGYGSDDYLCVFTSAGEVAVYRGTDPSSAATWGLMGVFYIGSPTGFGSTCKYGGDLLIINKDGIAQMSKSLMSSRVSTHLQMTDKIQPQLAADTTTYSTSNAWDILLFPPANMLLVNIPVSTTTTYQYVMNTISGAWSRWTGLNARCWYFANENLWFGTTTGKVCKAWDMQSDNGAKVVATILPAFGKIASDAQLKKWNMARVLYATDCNGQAVTTSFAVDFNRSPTIPVPPSLTNSSRFTWDVSSWDGTAVWVGDFQMHRDWRSISGLGYWGALQINMYSMNSDMRVFSIDYSAEQGGVI